MVSHFFSAQVFPEWLLNPGFETQKNVLFRPLNRGVPSKAYAHCSGTKFCVLWMEVSQGEVPLYIPGRIILLHQRMEESENVIWTFWSHINPHSPLHIAPKSLVKPPFQYVDVFKITHAQTHLPKQCNKQRWRSPSRIFSDFQHCIRSGGGGEARYFPKDITALCAGTQKLHNYEFQGTSYITVPRKLFPR